jgi:allantoicase
MQMDLTELVNLASERLGSSVIYANDEFFAAKENLIKDSAPVFIEGKYTDLGKWMDGWETRRKRALNLEMLSDWCLIRLGLPGIVRGVVVDTSHFRGNFPSHCSLEACAVEGQPSLKELLDRDWSEILPRTSLEGDSQNQFKIELASRLTHLRLNIFPDGGVARLRAYGEVVPDWDALRRRGSEVDFAAIENGGTVVDASDMFFGHRHNLIMPGRALDMSDGWETKRRRGLGHDWCVIRLGRSASQLTRVEVDTAWFKGNFPDACSIEVSDASDPSDLANAPWRELLPRTRLQAHTRHFFEKELTDSGAATHVRFNIYPDGGVSRLRVFGRLRDE